MTDNDQTLEIAAQMSNVLFNLAQKCGHTLTSDDCALFDKLRKEWDAERAPLQHEAIPYGWKMVPIEPTPEMTSMGRETRTRDSQCPDVIRAIYKAMIAAAPLPAQIKDE